MTKLISNYYIVSQDEIISRFSDKPDPIDFLEKSLTVKPKAFGKDKPEPMVLYKKVGDDYHIPYRWGVDHFGLAEDDTSLGYPIDIKLKKGVSPRAEQVEPLEQCKYHLEHSNRFLLQGMPGIGKCHGKDTPIMMYDGSFKMVQDINVGEQLMGPDSQPRNVLKTCVGYGELFRISPAKGETFVVNKDHVLNLHLSGKPFTGNGSPRRYVCGSGELVSAGSKFNISVAEHLSGSSSVKSLAKLWSPDGLDFDNRDDLSIDPYILGLWLGDGSSAGVALTTMDEELLSEWTSYFESDDYKISVVNPNRTAPLYRVTKKVRNSRIYNKHKRLFESYNLIKNKHIPDVYIKSSYANRMELLAGLIDTDGYINEGRCEIIQKSKVIADGIFAIATSLGFKVSSKLCTKRIKSTGFQGLYHRMIISGFTDKIPTRLARKKASERKALKNHLFTGFEIEQIEDGEFYGFELDDDHLYLATRSLFVNHNTFMAVSTMCHLKTSCAVVVGRGALIDQWREAIKQFTNLTDDDIGLVKADSFIFENKAVTLVSTDSFYNREFDESFLRNFGLVLWDEFHNFNAQEKSKAIGKFYAKYQMGMSATHDRVDGRDKVAKLWFGDIAVIAGNIDPVPIKVVLVPVKHDCALPVNYQYFREHDIDPRWSEISKLSELPFRNNIMLDMIDQEYSRGRHILCVSDRIEQLQYMHDTMLERGVPPADLAMAARSYYTGFFKVAITISCDNIEPHRKYIKAFSDDVKYMISKTKIAGRGFKTRQEVKEFIAYIQDLHFLNHIEVKNVGKTEKEKRTLKDKEVSDILYDRSKKIIFSSYGLLKEGVSIWWKDCLFDLTPQSRAEQLLGRIGRKAEGGEEKKEPIAYSVWDYGYLSDRIKRIHKNRLKNYKKMDYVRVVRK